MSTLRKLVDLLSHSVDVIEESYSRRGLSLPSLDDLYTPESDAVYQDPAVLQAATLASAAASQLQLLVRPAKATLTLYALEFFTPVALRTATELHVPEILRPAGPAGLHVDVIASKARTDPGRLSRVLRYLATQSVFKEVSPDVYANNRLSSLLDKRQDIDALLANPESNFDDPEARWAAIIGHLGHESARASNFLFENLSDPETASSGDPSKAPFNRAFNSEATMWEMFEKPGHERELKRFGLAMTVGKEFDPVEQLLASFNWTNIPEGRKIVDVGGGVGTVSKLLADSHSHLKIIVQDRPAVVADGLARWREHSGDSIKSERVIFQEHDFFKPQPVRDATVFFLRMIIHDWSDEMARIILRQLRDAAVPTTILLIMDRIVPYACKGLDKAAEGIPGLLTQDVPDVLPPNLGSWGPTTYHIDLNMLSLFNAQERTIGEWVRLLNSSKWKLSRVYQVDPLGQGASLIKATPKAHRIQRKIATLEA